MKYICVTNKFKKEEIFTFPSIVQHNNMLNSLDNLNYFKLNQKNKIVSAGFIIDNECFGESVSLGVKSRSIDTEIWLNQLNNED